MAENEIRFDDGAAYERFMGVWSRSVGDTFLDWLKPARGLAWLDVGCGNGAFTELLVERTAPSRVLGVDPSEPQLEFARSRHKGVVATFVKGDAQALPAADRGFDAAVMALVIFFVPDPTRGVTEMARAVRPGGSVSAYAWDAAGGGFPTNAIGEQLTAMGVPSLLPPSVDASRIEVLRSLWEGAGLTAIDTCAITVERVYADFEELWAVSMAGPRLSALSKTMSPAAIDELKLRVAQRLTPKAGGGIVSTARANAIKGRVPG